MQIVVTPNDIIQRCMWDKYKRFCLIDKNESEIQEIIENNKPVALKEEDAYVIGLLRIIETDNFIHRFNEDILDYLQIKSNIINDDLYILKSSIIKFIITYNDKFPSYYKPSFNYQKGLDELFEYIEKIKLSIDQLEIVTIKNKDKLYAYYMSKDIKKLLNL